MRVQRFLLVVAVVLVAALTGLWLQRSRPVWVAPRAVAIESNVPLMSLMPSWAAWESDAVDGKSQGLLLRDDDLIFSESHVPVRYHSSDGPRLWLTFDRGVVRMGDITVSVSLEESEGRAWLAKATDRQLAALRSVALPDQLDPATLEALKRLAAISPDVDLLFNEPGPMLEVLPFFHPVTAVADRHADVLRALADQPDLETLVIDASTAGSFDTLATLPKLRRLVIVNWDVERAGPLPAGLGTLKSLMVVDSDSVANLAPLSAAPAGLLELSLMGLENLSDLSGLERFSGLRTLILWNDGKIESLASLDRLEDLEWVGFPPKTSQKAFAAFVRSHPTVSILDLAGSQGITSLAPIASLKRLQGLILGGPYDSLDVLEQIESLRFVGIATKTWEAWPDKIAQLLSAMPDAMFVRVRPLCLGSGWILGLLPVVGFLLGGRRTSLSARGRD